jgi:hypothetical protein
VPSLAQRLAIMLVAAANKMFGRHKIIESNPVAQRILWHLICLLFVCVSALSTWSAVAVYFVCVIGAILVGKFFLNKEAELPPNSKLFLDKIRVFILCGIAVLSVIALTRMNYEYKLVKSAWGLTAVLTCFAVEIKYRLEVGRIHFGL